MKKLTILSIWTLFVVLLITSPMWIALSTDFYRDCKNLEENQKAISKEDALDVLSKYIDKEGYRAIVGKNPGVAEPNDGIFIYHRFILDQSCEVYTDDQTIVKVVARSGV